MTCPSYAALLATLEPGSEGAAASPEHVRRHLDDGCPHCERRLTLLQALASQMGRSPPSAVSEALRRRVLDQLGSPPVARPDRMRAFGAGLDRLREYLAELVQSEPAPAFATGLRSAPDQIHQVYEAGPFQVDVALVEGRSVIGQIWPGDDGTEPLDHDGTVCVLCGRGRSWESALDDGGDFRFHGVGPGRYALMIDGPDVRVIVTDLDLSGVARGDS